MFVSSTIANDKKSPKEHSFKNAKINVAMLLIDRERGFLKNSTKLEFLKLAELKAAISEMEETHCQLPSSVKSTFLMSFSPDNSKVASTHGDHKIYVCDVQTGKLLHKLEGHPRTPWCLAFHPTSNDILASGCLGGEVRVWDLHGGSERWIAENVNVIASLAFHPLDKVLVIATNNQIYFWDWSQPKPFATCKTNSEKEKVRFVKFDRLGTKLITGILNLNPTTSRSSTRDNISSSTVNSTPPSRRIPLHRSALRSYRIVTPAIRNIPLNRARQHEQAGLQDFLGFYHRATPVERLREPNAPISTSVSNPQPQTNYSSGSYRPGLFERYLNNSFRPMSSNFRREIASLFSGNCNRVVQNAGISSTVASRPSQNSNASSENSNISMGNSSTSSENSSLQNPNVTSTTHNEEVSSDEFWRTFQRLRSICTSLERRLRIHPDLQNNTDTQHSSEENLASSSIHTTGSSDSQRNENINRYLTSGFLISVLSRIRNSLRFSNFTSPLAQNHILQVRIRIREIMLRLSNVSNYRARLSSLRQQIYEAEENEQRTENEMPNRRWDLAHCLWLVEMSLQLTHQLQRILQIDYALAQQHLNNSHLSNSSNSDSSTLNTDRLLSSTNMTFSANRNITENIPDGPSNNSSQNSFYQNLREVTRETLVQALRSRSQLLQLNRELQRFQDDIRNLNNRTQNMQPNLQNMQSLPRVQHTADSLEHQLYQRLHRFQYAGSSNSNEFNSSSNNMLNTNTLPDDSDSDSDTSLEQSINDINDTHVVEELHMAPQLGSIRHQVVSFVPSRQRTASPDDLLQLSDSSSSDAESETPSFNFASPHRPPRLPPIFLSSFLNRNFSFPYTSLVNGDYLTDMGIQEAMNFTHRIQSWDFSKYEVPDITNSSMNVVVKHCVIHNDASIDISQDGELLVALVPPQNTYSHLSPVFSVYSLKSENLGKCLCTWGYFPNAISVSLSPLAQYVVVGLASPGPYLPNPEKEAVAQIVQLNFFGNTCTTDHVRSLTQLINTENRFPQVSLNSVRWLPQPGQGLIYGTNKGCLCICKPIAPMTLKKSQVKLNSMMQSSSISLGVAHHNRIFQHRMSTISTQTIEPLMHTTGTQTFSSENLSVA